MMERKLSLLAVWLALVLVPASVAQEGQPAKFIGAQNCSSAMCHGGAAEKKFQFTVWTRQDAHARAQATLTTARAARLAEVLKIADATKSSQCTSCHAPMAELEPNRLAGALRSEGVSCENCHGPAEKWLRSHTRPDFAHADRVHAGVRDLNNLYVRANSCVACHETLSRDLVAAGHPELIFEMDGQAVSQPRHWPEHAEYRSGQAWLVGQAVALREMSWQLSRDPKTDERLAARWQGLVWLLQKLGDVEATAAALPAKSAETTTEKFTLVNGVADRLAKAAAEMNWTEQDGRACLTKLAGSAGDFRDAKTTRAVHGRRAERLVLALDRLTAGMEKAQVAAFDGELRRLFQLAQSLPEFKPDEFARALEALSKKL